jgi:ParB-like chromosome segregation protein Spo0J
MKDPIPNGETHPVAKLFPLMPDEELDDLTTDIRENGLHQSIILDAEGMLLDGRNRLEACRRAGVEPSYAVLNGQDPVAFILSQNIRRRHLTQGQRAILVAKCLDSEHSANSAARKAGLSKGHVSQAALILKYAPELAEAILRENAKFDPSYQTAKQRMENAEHDRATALRLQAEDPELWSKVQDDLITLEEAVAELDTRKKEEQRKAQVKQQEREIKARHLFIILGSLALGDQPSSELAADLLDYDEETLRTAQLILSMQLWEKAIETLKECSAQWKGKQNVGTR